MTKIKDLYETQYKTNSAHRQYVKKQGQRLIRKSLAKFYESAHDTVYSLIERGRREKCLDVGCNNGNFLFSIKDYFKELYGIDIAETNIKKAKNLFKNHKRAYFIQGNVDEGLKFQNDAFDLVTCLAVLEHVFDPYDLLNEIYRVLKPNGHFIVEVPNIAYLKYRINLLFGILPKTSIGDFSIWKNVGWDGGHLHYFTVKTLKGALEDSGFICEKITGSGLFANLRSLCPQLLTGNIVISARKKNNKAQKNNPRHNYL